MFYIRKRSEGEWIGVFFQYFQKRFVAQKTIYFQCPVIFSKKEFMALPISFNFSFKALMCANKEVIFMVCILRNIPSIRGGDI